MVPTTETHAYIVLCTAPDADVAARLARGLVEARLAACVNILPGVRSFYVWKGEICDEGELQLLIKTHEERLDEVGTWLETNHPYDVPEILHIRVAGGSAAYLGWLEEQTVTPRAQ